MKIGLIWIFCIILFFNSFINAFKFYNDTLDIQVLKVNANLDLAYGTMPWFTIEAVLQPGKLLGDNKKKAYSDSVIPAQYRSGKIMPIWIAVNDSNLDFEPLINKYIPGWNQEGFILPLRKHDDDKVLLFAYGIDLNKYDLNFLYNEDTIIEITSFDKENKNLTFYPPTKFGEQPREELTIKPIAVFIIPQEGLTKKSEEEQKKNK